MSGHHKSTAFLLGGISQYEVDFVIPRLGVDVPLGIDPFLLFKSRNSTFVDLHRQIMSLFSAGIQALKERDIKAVEYLFQFPEVSEIGLGYTKGGKRGSGMGSFLSELTINTLQASPLMLDRGLRHIEELQLISVGIGADRISDMAASILKEYLISYTQEQCSLWNIPIQPGVPISHILDSSSMRWVDGYFDLPVSPVDHSPIILVPRRIVRELPWINYDDFTKSEFSTFLRAKAAKGGVKLPKQEVISVNRNEIERVERYIQMKEENSSLAQPTAPFKEDQEWRNEINALRERLRSITSGAATASDFQHAILEALNILFNPQLIDGRLEVATVDGTERRDIIFLNDSDQTFWDYIRQEHSSILLMFEIKNTENLGMDALNQTAAYLGNRLGRLGFIVTRKAAGENLRKKAFSVYNDGGKIILVLSDEDIHLMLDMKSKDKNPMRHIQEMYRTFRSTVQ